MAWFIVQCERKTWTKYLVEAENEDAAIYDPDKWEYIGYVDGEDTETTVFGPLESKADALADIASYMEGS